MKCLLWVLYIPNELIGKWNKAFELAKEPVQNQALHLEQNRLAHMLKSCSVKEIIQSEKFEFWDVAEWDLAMVDTAKQISDKWVGL